MKRLDVKSLSLCLCLFLAPHVAAAPVSAACRIVYSDGLVSAMAKAGAPLSKYYGSYATYEECMAAVRMAVRDSGDPTLAHNMSCECDGSGAGSGGGGMNPFAGGLPTTEGQAQQMVMGLLFQSLFSSGPSAADQAAQQQQQALLKQQQELEKQKAEMLQKERAAQASSASSLWAAQDQARGQALGDLFGPPASESTVGMSSLLKKQALLQLQAAAAPVDASSDEAMRQSSGAGFDEPGKALAGLPAVPEPPEPMPVQSMDPALVLKRMEQTKTRLVKVDKDLEAARDKREKTGKKLDKARQEQAEIKEKARTGDGKEEEDALLAELEAEEARIEALSREMDEASAKVEDLERQREKEARELETLNKKLEAAKAP